MVDLFWDEASEQFYDTGRDHEELVLRPRDMTDNAIPSGSSMDADVLLRLGVITGDPDAQRRAVMALRSARELMARYPAGAGHYLCALDFYLSAAKEIAIVGERSQPDTRALADEVYRHFLPNRVLVGKGNGGGSVATLPLMEGREKTNGRATAYVCQNYVCDLPVNEPSDLARQLAV
jgi:uncharacterized protein YyaL (SSP411 family)